MNGPNEEGELSMLGVIFIWITQKPIHEKWQ